MAGMFFINLNVADFLGLEQKFTKAVEQEMKAAVRDLSAMTLAHIKEKVQRELHTTRDKYNKALSTEEVDGGELWVINLDMKQAGWIEEGLKPHEMIADMLKSKKVGKNGKPWVKTSKDGSKYASVAFDHKKGPASQSPEATDLTDAIKAEFKKRKIPYNKIEKDDQGQTKLGLLHSLNVPTPKKTHNGPGQGWGVVGAPRQGATGIPFLHGVQVHQKEVEELDAKTGKKGKKTVRAIMTYRMVSSKMMGSGRWFHPGISPKLLIDEGYEWALGELENTIITKTLDSIIKAL